MKLAEVLSPSPQTCLPSASLEQVAQMMRDQDVGEIPVADEANRPLGVVTDRDIVLRVVAAGGDPRRASAGDCMTAPAVTIPLAATLEECARLMARQRIRRVPVVDGEGRICGIVALADLEASRARSLKAEVTRQVSKPH
jgi:CBS domain-containing protein